MSANAETLLPESSGKCGILTPYQLFASIVLVTALLALVLTVNGYYVYVLANVALMTIVGVGLNVLLGLSGQVSFGHVGFYALGAYAVAILTGRFGFDFWAAWPLAAVIAGLVGALLALPALRVKGPYLAMITIAFGLVVEHSIVELRDLTGGQNGIMGIVAPRLGGIVSSERVIPLLAVLLAIFSLACFSFLSRGTWGIAMRAVRDSDTAAESIGLNPLSIKTVAFAISAVLAGLAGGLFAPLSGIVTPHTFGFFQSILFLLVVMIGGSGSVLGPFVGATIVGLLPELLSSLEEYRLLFFGCLLMLILWLAPEGVVGLLRRIPWLAFRESAKFIDGEATLAVIPAPAMVKRKSLRAEALSCVFGGVRAVSELSFNVTPGAITSLIGPNGAGKSTALNMLSGFYRPSAGRFFLDDRALDGKSAFRIARAGIGRSYQTSQLFGSLSVLDNVSLAVSRGQLGPLLSSERVSSASAQKSARIWLAWCGYGGSLETKAADLSHVNRRLVELARALATVPDVLLLDEPAAGLSHEDKSALSSLLRRIAAQGIGVVLVEHDMSLVMGVSDHIVVLDAGQHLACGSPTEIQNNPAVRQAYLGESMLQTRQGEEARVSASKKELLGVTSLTAGYGAEPVVQDIRLRVREGEMVALLGANGAGKTTLMRSLAGLHRPVKGSLHFSGVELSALTAEGTVALGLVLVPEGRQVFPELSVIDNLRLGAFLKPEGCEARIEDMLNRFPKLRERLHLRAGLLSGGEQQMLAIGRALMACPRMLLLDEPSLGLAPKVIAELFAALDQLRKESMTILLVDQMAALALSLADRAYVIERGCLVAEGSASEIAGNDALTNAYLGI